MNRCVTALLRSILVAGLALLAGCGSSSNAPPATSTSKITDKPNVIITVDGAQHACVVALYTEPQGSSIPCSDLIAFLRDELRVPSGAIYDLHTTPAVDQAEVAKVQASLKNAGYRFNGGPP